VHSTKKMLSSCFLHIKFTGRCARVDVFENWMDTEGRNLLQMREQGYVGNAASLLSDLTNDYQTQDYRTIFRRR
jgi:hypothetical protein